MKRLNTLVLGGCLVNMPIVATPRAKDVLDYERYGPFQLLHSFRQMHQRIQFIRGERDFPPTIRMLCRFPRDLKVLPGIADFHDLDATLVEPTTPVDLVFRGFSINRRALQRVVYPAAGEDDEATAAIIKRWFRGGLVGFNEETRKDAAEYLLTRISNVTPRDRLARVLVNETRGVKCDLLGGLRALRDVLKGPMGLALYNFRYMPDGRAISWPQGFREETVDAAKSLGLPIYDPTSLVVGYGTKSALLPKDGHYTKEFLPIMGDALVTFIESVHAQSAIAPAHDREPAWASEGQLS